MAKLAKVNTDEISQEFVEDVEIYNLLAGYIDEDGLKHTTFTLRELNGKDEEAIYSSTHKANAAKMAHIILERCVTSVGTLTREGLKGDKWREMIQSLTVGDQDYMLTKLREISVGDELELKHECPHCKANLTTYVGIDELEITPFKGEYNIPFTLPKGYRDREGTLHQEGTMRLATGLDREILLPTAKKNIAKGNTLMITRLCSFESGLTVTQDVMASLSLRDRKYLQEVMKDNAFGYDTHIDIDCTECGESFKAVVNPTNFF